MASKDQSIDNIFHVYGIVNAFSNGRLPSNEQIDITLNSFLSQIKQPNKDLSAEGKDLTRAFADVVSKAKLLLLSKNNEEQLQNFIYETSGAVKTTDKSASVDGSGISGPSQGAQENAMKNLRTVGMLLVSNGQFRKLLSDFTLILRDMAAEGATNTANKIRPESLEGVTEPAEEGQFDQNGKKAPTTDDIPQGEEAKKGVDKAANQTANDVSSQVADYFGKRFSPEVRDSAWFRLKKMIVEVQGKEDYKQAINSLLDLVEDLTKQSGGSMAQSGSSAEENFEHLTREGQPLHPLVYIRSLLENFNQTSLDGVLDTLFDLKKQVQKDKQVGDYFSELQKFVRECLTKEGMVLEDDSDRKFKDLQKKGRHLFEERYSDGFNRLMEEVQYWFSQFAEDQQSVEFGESLKHLFNKLKWNKESFSLNTFWVSDVFQTLMPALFSTYLQYVPAPRVEVSNPAVDVVIENMIIESGNLLPNNLSISNSNFVRLSSKDKSFSHSVHRARIRLEGVQMNLREMNYYLKKKQGFPSIEDVGLADVYLGHGADIEVTVASSEKSDASHFYNVEDVTVSVRDMDIKLRKSKYKPIFIFTRPVLMRTLKQAVTHALEKTVRDLFESGDRELWEMHKDVKSRKQKYESLDDEDAPSTPSMYFQALGRRITLHREEKKDSDTEVHAAMTSDDARMKGIKLPHQRSDQAQKWKNESLNGNTWHSGVFALGSASTTKDLPHPSIRSRKPSIY